MSAGSESYFLTHAPQATLRLQAAFADDGQTLARAERELGSVAWHDDVAVCSWAVRHPFNGAVALALLSDDPLSIAGLRLRDVLPELWGLSVPQTTITHEHDPSGGGFRPTPLLDHALRALAVAERAAADLDAVAKSLLTAALLFGDVAKGGTLAQRETWRARLGVDGTVHNEDSAEILQDVVKRVLGKAALSEDGRWAEYAEALVAVSGLVGMRLRGEVGRDALAEFHEFAKDQSDEGAWLIRIWSILNHCDTQAVRKGLWTPKLAQAFAEEELAIMLPPSSHRSVRLPLAERIARMRGGALMTRESTAEVDAALEQLRVGRSVLEGRMAKCRVWYAEAALGGLSVEATCRLFLHLSAAALHAGIDATRPFHLDLLGVVKALRDDSGMPRRYPTRLLETILANTSIEDLLAGKLGGPGLVSFSSSMGGEQALAVTFERTCEAEALLTLLDVYETKNSAAFHQTLKHLCDVYALRKDDYDRVHNESAYLASMNSARGDKARMLDFVKPGTIVEVGPGGAVLLELLAERYPQSRIIGLDASKGVVDAHLERIGTTHPGYDMIHGDAFELPKIIGQGGADSVVFCSVLHEIFSYVPWGTSGERYQTESVMALVAAAYRALKPGGRLVIRDGVMPVDEPRVVLFKNPAWREGLDLFKKHYEPRVIEFEQLSETRVRMSAPDLYEFLTTFTWGPDSFPYEVREQRAVLPRAEYMKRMLAACNAVDNEHPAREVEIPPDLASYLQPGYPENILPHVSILDAAGENELPMFDVNGVWVIEKG